MLHGVRDDLLNLLVGDGGLRGDGVDGAAANHGLEERRGGRHYWCWGFGGSGSGGGLGGLGRRGVRGGLGGCPGVFEGRETTG